MLTVRAAAERLGIGYSTLKHWIRQGQVRTSLTAGGHHRIAEAEVDRLLAPHPGARPTTTSAATSGLIVGISGRNRLRGYVEEVRIDGLLGQVRLRIGDIRLTSVVTADALKELKLRRGDSATALIKSTDVMIARELGSPTPPPPRRVKVPRRAGRSKTR